ncbi:MAG TPA: GNAT family N-acetyltransferase [Microlunatus sp.]|nr:GNAT family N-acetyltransferase [Microlunatus sp.]
MDVLPIPVLRTDRLTLRQPELTDAEDVLVFRGDPEVQRFNSEPHTSVAESVDLIREIRREHTEGTGMGWVATLTTSGRAIGLVGFSGWDRFHRRAEVGYDLARDLWGRGLAREALRSVVEFGFTRMDLHRVEAATIADNHASVRLLERCGFVREGTRRACSWEDDGTFHDSAIYGILDHEWSRQGG